LSKALVIGRPRAGPELESSSAGLIGSINAGSPDRGLRWCQRPGAGHRFVPSWCSQRVKRMLIFTTFRPALFMGRPMPNVRRSRSRGSEWDDKR